MRRCFVVVMALLATAGVASAATEPIAKGTKALIFDFGGLSVLNLGEFNGGIGFRHYMADNVALRLGVNGDFSSTTDKAHPAGSTDEKTTSNGFGLSACLERHMVGPANVSPYLGIGAGFDWSSTKFEPSHVASPPAGTPLEVKSTSTGVTAFGAAGFEWFFTESVSLGGEYNLGLTFGSSKTENENQGAAKTTTSDDSNVSVGFSTASVFVSVNWP